MFTYIVKFTDDGKGTEDYGLYVRGYRNPDTGTPLYARGDFTYIMETRAMLHEND